MRDYLNTSLQSNATSIQRTYKKYFVINMLLLCAASVDYINVICQLAITDILELDNNNEVVKKKTSPK